MKLDNFTAYVQAILSAIYLICTFTIIIIYELGYARLPTGGQEKTFDSMVNWMTGGALIVLYFWLQRAKGQTQTPDPESTTTTVTQTTAPIAAPIETVTTAGHPRSAVETVTTAGKSTGAAVVATTVTPTEPPPPTGG